MTHSILQKDLGRCLVCGTTRDLHLHHVFYGSGNRKNSEKDGMTVKLCARHHNMSDDGVHFNKQLDEEIKEAAQKIWEETYGSRDDFIKRYGRSYL